MKQIKPIALKKATILSNEEMKTIFGGSSTVSSPEDRLKAVCNLSASCIVDVGGSSVAGSCGGLANESSVSCYCVYTLNGSTASAADSSCFKV
ncbi:MAG: hypothetical protein RR061_09955 [Muribaculaceae bacterium]